MNYFFFLHFLQKMSSLRTSSLRNPSKALSKVNCSNILRPCVKGRLRSRKSSKAMDLSPQPRQWTWLSSWPQNRSVTTELSIARKYSHHSSLWIYARYDLLVRVLLEVCRQFSVLWLLLVQVHFHVQRVQQRTQEFLRLFLFYFTSSYS